MKQEFDKEMDSLLRRGSRLAASGPRSASPSRVSLESPHLDADELSAFAENALPVAARSHYASHLADCDECRQVVVQLASAADVAGEIEKRAAVVPVVPVEIPWWKSMFGALSTPRLMRYAAPVLVLGLVGVVSFIALRPRDGRVPATVYQTDSVSNKEVARAPDAQAGSPTGGIVSPPNANSTASTATAEKKAATAAGGQTTSSTEAKAGEKDASPADKPAPLVAKEAGPGASGADADTKPKTESLAASAPAPPPPAKAAPETTEPKKGEREDTARNKAAEEEYAVNDRSQQAEQNRAMQKRGMEVQSPDGSSRNETRSNTVNNRGYAGGQSAQQTRERQPARRAKAEDKSRDGAADDEDAANLDARSVAGHRFQRRNNVWVDVNYKTSMSMTGVRRGTDQYRALVADLPELGRIAEQLGGEVIAVVKGRAYRIR